MSMQKHVLLICFSQDLIPRHESMLKALNCAGYQTTVLTWNRAKQSQTKISGTRYLNVDVPAPLSSLKIIFSLPKYYSAALDLLSNESDFDVCICTHMMALPLQSRIKARKKVYDIAEYLNFDLSDYFGIFRGLIRPLIEAFEKYYIRRVDGVSYVGSRDNWLGEYVSLAPTSVEINNFPDLSRQPDSSIVNQLSEKYSAKKVAVYAGGLSRDRGVEILIDAAQKINKIDSNVHFILLGRFRAETQSILDKIDAQQMESYVEVISHIDYEQMLAYLHVAKLGLALYQIDKKRSASDKFGLYNSRKILTYMKMSAAVLVSDGNPFADFVLQEGCGDVVDQNNQAELVNKILCLVNDKGELAKRGYQAIKNNYNWLSEEQKYLKFMRQV